MRRRAAARRDAQPLLDNDRVLLTVGMIILSAFINYNFGYSLGTTETNARIFGAVSVVAVGVTALLPLRISAHWEEGQKARSVLGACVFGIRR